GLELARQRIHIFLGFVVQIGNGQVSAKCAERGGTSPRDRSLVCDAYHEPFFPLEQLRLDGGDQSNLSLPSQIDRLATDISFRSLLEAGKCLAPIPGLGGPRYFPTVHGQLAFAPGSDVDLELLLPDLRKELLNRCAPTAGRSLFGSQVTVSRGMAIFPCV